LTDESECADHEILADEVVVVASRTHAIHRKRVRMKDLLGYKWVLAAPGVATRQWLDHAFITRGLPAPSVQIETNILLMLPPLIEKNQLLSFISRRHAGPGSVLREVTLRATTMRRTFAVTYLRDSYLSPAGPRLVQLLRA